MPRGSSRRYRIVYPLFSQFSRATKGVGSHGCARSTHGAVAVLKSRSARIHAGLFRTRGAGYLILVVTVVPIVLATLGAASYRPLLIGLLQLPFIISGALFLVAHRRQEHRQRSAVVPGTPAVQRHRAQ